VVWGSFMLSWLLGLEACAALLPALQAALDLHKMLQMHCSSAALHKKSGSQICLNNTEAHVKSCRGKKT
jgi:hypothetical protein